MLLYPGFGVRIPSSNPASISNILSNKKAQQKRKKKTKNPPKPNNKREALRKLPAEVAGSDGKIVEVRFICDNCGTLIGTEFMRKTQAESRKNTEIACQNCRKQEFVGTENVQE